MLLWRVIESWHCCVSMLHRSCNQIMQVGVPDKSRSKGVRFRRVMFDVNRILTWATSIVLVKSGSKWFFPRAPNQSGKVLIVRVNYHEWRFALAVRQFNDLAIMYDAWNRYFKNIKQSSQLWRIRKSWWKLFNELYVTKCRPHQNNFLLLPALSPDITAMVRPYFCLR